MIQNLKELNQLLSKLGCNPMDAELINFFLIKTDKGSKFKIPQSAYVFAENVKTNNGEFSRINIYDAENPQYNIEFNGHTTYDEAQDVEKIEKLGYFIKVTATCVTELHKYAKEKLTSLIPLNS